MKATKCFVLSCAAGAVFATAAFAQQEPLERVTHFEFKGVTTPSGQPVGGFGARDFGAVFDCWDPNRLVNATFLAAGNKQIIENISFAGGPWANETGRVITELDTLLGINAGGAAGNFDCLVDFFNDTDVSFTGFTGSNTAMINASAVPLASFRLQVTNPTVGSAAFQGWNLATPPATGVAVPDGHNIFIRMTLVAPGTTTQLANGNGPTFVFGTLNSSATNGITTNPSAVGTGDADYGRDVDGNGTIIGNNTPPFSGANEHRQLIADFDTPPDGINEAAMLNIALRGNITAVAPAAEEVNASGCLADGPTTRTAAMPAAGVKWYHFCLNSDATDSAGAGGQFIDIDTEGSAADASIAVFTSGGSLIDQDANSGSGFNAQLSFGMGRRAAVGDGRQYDGRNSDDTGTAHVAGLGAGGYYLAVAPNGSTFSDGFTVTPGATGGAVTVNFNTNTNGAALAPSVAPAVLQDLGTLTAPGAQIATRPLGAREVAWYKFTTCTDADASNNVSIDIATSDSLVNAITLFNASGNLVAAATGTAAPSTASLSFNTAGSLPAGVYYMALTYDAGDVSASAMTNGRFHIRSDNASNGFNFPAEVVVQNAACGPTCGSADFNHDGDTATDADIEAFFACLAGNCCATCDSADFNGDGDTATDADIESFFRVLAGGPC
jgi:hypothetical protein